MLVKPCFSGRFKFVFYLQNFIPAIWHKGARLYYGFLFCDSWKSALGKTPYFTSYPVSATLIDKVSLFIREGRHNWMVSWNKTATKSQILSPCYEKGNQYV